MDVSKLGPSAADTEGVWFEWVDPFTGAHDPNARVKVASERSPAYSEAVRKLTNEQVERMASGRRRTRGKGLGEGMQRAQRQAVADHLVLDWQGWTEGGEPLPCTPENKRRLCEIDAFREFVLDCANDYAAFDTEALGNSPSGPGPTSVGADQ